MKRFLMILLAAAVSLTIGTPALAAPISAYTDVQYKQCAVKLTREADVPGGYIWAPPGFRGSTSRPYLYAGTNYRLVRGLGVYGKPKYQADLKAERLIPANIESGQYPNTEKRLMASFCWPDAADKTLYQVKNFNPN